MRTTSSVIFGWRTIHIRIYTTPHACYSNAARNCVIYTYNLAILRTFLRRNYQVWCFETARSSILLFTTTTRKPLFGYTDLDAGRRYQNMCVITKSRLVNGFVSILQHLRNNLKVLRLTSDGIRGASWKTLKDLGGFPHLTLAHPRNVRLQRHP